MLNARVLRHLVVVIIQGLSVGAVAAQECRQSNPWVKAVRSVALGITAADNDRSLAKVLSFYAHDALLTPPNENPVKGIAAIRARYESLFANFDPKIEGRIEEVCVTHRLGFVRGHNGGQLISRNGGETRQLADDYLMLLKRNRDGTWRITHLSWHRSQ